MEGPCRLPPDRSRGIESRQHKRAGSGLLYLHCLLILPSRRDMMDRDSRRYVAQSTQPMIICLPGRKDTSKTWVRDQL